MAILELQDVKVSEGEKVILDNLNFAIEEKERVTIIGPNGAGKTTLLRVMLGLRRPDEGKIIRRSGLSFGYVPQQLPLNPLIPMTVEGFLNLSGRADKKTVSKLMEETGIATLAQQSIHRLSGGEMQRMLLARALARRPDVLVLDEPAQQLDFNGQIQLYRLIDAVYEQYGCAVILVSHDLHLVMRSANRVICLYHHICCSGKPENILGDAAFTRLFGENITEVLAYYHHHHGGHTHENIPNLECGHDH